MTTVEIYKQRLVGKPRDVVWDEFVKSIANQAISEMFIDHYPNIIRSMMYANAQNAQYILWNTMRVVNIPVFKFVIDSYDDLGQVVYYSLIMRLCIFVLYRAELQEYIPKVFQLQEIEVMPTIYCDRVLPNSLIIAVDIMAKHREKSRFAILFECKLSKSVFTCMCMVISSDDFTKNDAYNFVQSVIRYDECDALTKTHYKAVECIADKFPYIAYRMMFDLDESCLCSRMYMKTFKYVVARCDIQTLNKYIPNYIKDFDRYLILMNAGINPQLMSECIIYTLNKLHYYDGELLLILTHHYARGYTVFDSINYIPESINLAMKMYKYDDSAERYLRADACKQFLNEVRFNIAYRGELLKSVFELFHQN